MIDRGRRISSTSMLRKRSLPRNCRPRPSCMCAAVVFSLALSSHTIDAVGALDDTQEINQASSQVRSIYHLRRRIKRINRMVQPSVNQTRILDTIEQENNSMPSDKTHGDSWGLSRTIELGETISLNDTRIPDVIEQGGNSKAPSDNTTDENSELSSIPVHSEGKRIMKMAFGLSIVTITSLSLFGWAYIFYIRFQNDKEFRAQVEEENPKTETIAANNDSPCWSKSGVDQVRRSSSPTTVHTTTSSDNINTLGTFSTSFEDFYKGSDDDSFGKELQTAAKVDQHVWVETTGGNAPPKVSTKPVRLLAPPARDVVMISSKNNNHKDFAPESYGRHPHLGHGMESRYSKVLPFRLKRSTSPIMPDPEDVVLTSGSSTSSSYLGKNSSVEEGESSGFSVIHYHTSCDEQLLSPVLVHDDESLGQHSGMEMSLGTDNGRFSPTGFFVIDDKNDPRHEYISKEEYEAAVKAAAYVLNNGRQSPIPSDERLGLSLNPSDEIMQDIVEKLDTTPETDAMLSSSTTSSSSNLPPTLADNSKTSGCSESTSNVLSELKDVSIFLEHYEKKKSRKSQKAQEKSLSGKSTHPMEPICDEHPDTDISNTSSDPSTLDHTPVKTVRQRKQKQRLQKFSFARGIDPSTEVVEPRHTHEDKNISTIGDRVKISTLPPLRPSHQPGNATFKNTSTAPNESENQEKLSRNNELQQHTNNVESKPSESHASQSKVHTLRPAVRSVASGPSADSSMSNGMFLETEIESFFSNKDPSISNLLSETARSFSQANSTQQSFPGDITFSTSVDTHTTISEKGKFSRLGIVPFNPKETAKSALPSLKHELPIIGFQDTEEAINQQSDKKLERTRSKKETPIELTSSPRNTSHAGFNYHDIVPPSNIRVTPRSRIRQRNKLSEQQENAAKLNSNAIEKCQDVSASVEKLRTRSDDPEISITQAAMTSLQSSTRKIASLFESRSSGEKDGVELRQHQSESEPYTVTRKDLSSKTLQRKPSAYNAGEVKRVDTSGQTNYHERIKPYTSESMKTVMQSGAQSLITMFESKVPTISKGQKIWNNRRSANSVSIGREKKTQQTNQTNNVLQVCNEVLPPTFVQNNRGSSRASFSKLRVQTMNEHVNSVPSPSTKELPKRSSTPSRASFSKLRVQRMNEHVNSVPSPSTKELPKRSSTPPQKAKSLISIFESKKPASDAPPIFPQSEHWQYGKMRGG